VDLEVDDRVEFIENFSRLERDLSNTRTNKGKGEWIELQDIAKWREKTETIL